MVQEAVREGGGDDRISEHLAPFSEAAVRGQDHGAFLVAGVDQLEEQVGAAGGDRQVADLVDDEQRGARVEADLLGQSPLAFGLVQRRDQIGQGGAVDASAGLHRRDAERCGQMTLPGARRPEEVDHLGAADEVELGQGGDPIWRSSDGWKPKSKPSRVFTGSSLAVRRATSIRRVSRVALLR